MLDNKFAYLIKASRKSKDIESVCYGLKDIATLSSDELKPFEIKKEYCYN